MSALARLGPFFASTRQLTTSAARYQTSTPPAAASLAQVAPTSDETPAAAAAESSLAGREVSHPAAAAAAASRIPPPLPPPVPEPVEPAPVARVRRPIGAFRGGQVYLRDTWTRPFVPCPLTRTRFLRLIGFLLGVTAVGGFGYFQLLDDYTKASSLLLMSVEELKSSTEQVRWTPSFRRALSKSAGRN